MSRKKIIGITLGDPHGIGPEVVLKALCDISLLEKINPVIYGSDKVLNLYTKQLSAVGKAPSPGSFDVVKCNVDLPEFSPGKSSPQSAAAAAAFLSKGVEHIKSGILDGLVTGPIDKNTIYSPKFPYRGHTEYFADIFDCKETLMTMVSEKLRVALMTTHVPLNEVSGLITKQGVKSKILLFERSLITDFGIANPAIAVLGLNPHSGDQGLIGKEDQKMITPVVQRLQQSGKHVVGPFAADGFFGSEKYKRYDGILAMYHDQGLTPFKLLSFNHGVNYTGGLPFVRTSPDHGVAYNLAGKNKANENPMQQALYVAATILETKT